MKVLPLKFKYENGKMLLTENYSDSKLNIGDELISMNKISIGEVLRPVQRQFRERKKKEFRWQWINFGL
jgi:hypothetical protein